MKVVLLEGQEAIPEVKKDDALTAAVKGVPGPVWVILFAKFVLKWF